MLYMGRTCYQWFLPSLSNLACCIKCIICFQNKTAIIPLLVRYTGGIPVSVVHVQCVEMPKCTNFDHFQLNWCAFLVSCRQYRHTAYRQLVRWCWGWLGRHNRVELPACALTSIREQFPSPDGNYCHHKRVGQDWHHHLLHRVYHHLPFRFAVIWTHWGPGPDRTGGVPA